MSLPTTVGKGVQLQALTILRLHAGEGRPSEGAQPLLPGYLYLTSFSTC